MGFRCLEQTSRNQHLTHRVDIDSHLHDVELFVHVSIGCAHKLHAVRCFEGPVTLSIIQTDALDGHAHTEGSMMVKVIILVAEVNSFDRQFDTIEQIEYET